MKKRLCALAVLVGASASFAEPHKDFSNIVQNFAQTKGMEYQGLSQTGDNGQFDKDVWTYAFASPSTCTKNCESMSITFEYAKTKKCIPAAGLFGDMPLNIGGHSALFSSFTLADPTSRSRDVLYADDGKGGCYAVSYGFKGSRFNESFGLVKSLLEE